ncbi:hypothetical protein [Kitasatospora sp. NPDC004272]
MKARQPADSAVGPRSPSPKPVASPAAPGEVDQQPPRDLVTWAQFAEEMKRTPYPVDRRALQRHFERAGKRAWMVPGQRGWLVSRSDALEVHRDFVLSRQQAVVA